MTKSQLIELLGVNNIDTEGWIYIDKIDCISFAKDLNTIKSEITNTRFKFDGYTSIGENLKANVLEVIFVRPFSQNGTLPEHGKYDILDYQGVQTVFEYLTNPATGEVLVDYYSFDDITVIDFK
jgi:hypothetical protein